MKEQLNNGPFYFLIVLALGFIYLLLWAYLKPKKKDNYPKPGKVKKMDLDKILPFDEADMYK